MDKLAAIEAFVAIVETGSFGRAAERLGIGTPLVSRRLGQLETALGIQLLQRTTRTSSLTGPGRDYYARATRVLADLEDAEQAIVDDSAALRGQIRVAGPLSFGLRHLIPATNDFLDENPGLSLDLDLNDREVNLVEEGFDMAVRIGRLQDSSLLARRLGTARFVTCASPAYLARYGTPTRPEELSQHIGLHYSNVGVSQAWRFLDAKGNASDGTPQIRLRVNNGDALCAAAVAGLGIIRSPTFVAADEIVAGRLQTLMPDFHNQTVGIHAVFPPGRLVPRRIRVLTDYLASRFGELPEWDRRLGID